MRFQSTFFPHKEHEITYNSFCVQACTPLLCISIVPRVSNTTPTRTLQLERDGIQMGNVRIPLTVAPSELSIFASITLTQNACILQSFIRSKAISIKYCYFMYFYLNYLAWKSMFFVLYYVRSSTARLALSYFSLSSRKRHDVRGNVCFDFNFYMQPLSRQKEFWYILSHTYSSLRVKCPIFFPDCNQTRIFSTDFNKAPNIKFHDNPSTWSRAVTCQQTARHDDGNSRFLKLHKRG